MADGKRSRRKTAGTLKRSPGEGRGGRTRRRRIDDIVDRAITGRRRNQSTDSNQ